MLTFREYLAENEKPPLARMRENKKLYRAFWDYLQQGTTRPVLFFLDSNRDKLRKYKMQFPSEYRTTSSRLLYRGVRLDKDDAKDIVSGKRKFKLGKTGSWTENIVIAEAFASGDVGLIRGIPTLGKNQAGIVFAQKWTSKDIIVNIRRVIEDMIEERMTGFLLGKRAEYEVILDTSGNSLTNKNIYKVYTNGISMSPDTFLRMEK